MAPAVHENDRPPALNGCEWHEALNPHAMNSVLCLVHVKPPLLMSIFQSAFRGRSNHSVFKLLEDHRVSEFFYYSWLLTFNTLP